MTVQAYLNGLNDLEVQTTDNIHHETTVDFNRS
jgi:hypothetical protein